MSRRWLEITVAQYVRLNRLFQAFPYSRCHRISLQTCAWACAALTLPTLVLTCSNGLDRHMLGPQGRYSRESSLLTQAGEAEVQEGEDSAHGPSAEKEQRQGGNPGLLQQCSTLQATRDALGSERNQAPDAH
ncbi:unnamed protein product [Bubo scandiacus]